MVRKQNRKGPVRRKKRLLCRTFLMNNCANRAGFQGRSLYYGFPCIRTTRGIHQSKNLAHYRITATLLSTSPIRTVEF